MVEIVCSQWNHAYLIVENVVYVFKMVYLSFSEGREVNLPHASRSATSVNEANIGKVYGKMLEDPRVGIKDIVEYSRVSQYLVLGIRLV